MVRKMFRPVFLYDGDSGGNNGGGQPPAPTTTPKPEHGDDKKFSQADVDRIVGERAQRAADAATGKLLETLGVKDADELKSRLTKFAELEKNQLSEKERLEKELADEKAKREDAEKKRDEMKTRANEKLIRAAFVTEAAKPDYAFQEAAIPDLWALLTKEQRESLKLKDDDGVENLDKVLKELAETKKHLLKPKPTTPGTPRPAGSNQKPSQPTPDDEAAKRVARQYQSQW